MSSFIPKNKTIVKDIIQKYADAVKEIDDDIHKKVVAATDVVWRVAHARRPKIAASKGNRGKYRVSDPNASAGVPVATGALQASIEQKVVLRKGNWVGSITAGNNGVDYAGYIEFGTSRIAPRPFMRAALAITKDTVAKIFRTPRK
jgi:HK97 gp10 family phage protein